MFGKDEVVENIGNLIEPILAGLGYDLLEVKLVVSHGRRTLRIFIDKPGGVTVEDCAQASRAIGSILDEEDFISGRYYLEVSSPGAERPLKQPHEFKHFKGRKVFVRLRQPMLSRTDFEGVIDEFEENQLHLRLEDGTRLTIPFEQILNANLSL